MMAVDKDIDSNGKNIGVDDKLMQRSKELETVTQEIDSLINKYDNVLDMRINLIAYLGSTKISLLNFLKLSKGSIINLEKAAGEGANFSLNDCVVGKGEIMVYEKNLAIRINEILGHNAIIYHFYSELDQL